MVFKCSYYKGWKVFIMRKRITNFSVAITIFLIVFVPILLIFDKVGVNEYLGIILALIIAAFFKHNIKFEAY